MKNATFLIALMLISTSVFAMGFTDPNDPAVKTQNCIKSYYDACGYKPPRNTKSPYKITNACMIEKIEECYCRHQGMNCPENSSLI